VLVTQPHQAVGTYRQTNQQKTEHRADPNLLEERDHQAGSDQKDDRIM